MNIFVARLNFDTTSEDLESAFAQFGEVDSAKVIMDKFTGKSRGFGFVEMPNDDEAYQAIEALNDSDFDGNTIVVKKAEPREGRGGGGGGYGNRGGGGGYGNRGGGGGYGNRGGGGRPGGRPRLHRDAPRGHAACGVETRPLGLWVLHAAVERDRLLVPLFGVLVQP